MPLRGQGPQEPGAVSPASELATFVITEQPRPARLLEHQGGMGFLPVPWEPGPPPAHSGQGGHQAPSDRDAGSRIQGEWRVWPQAERCPFGGDR